MQAWLETGNDGDGREGTHESGRDDLAHDWREVDRTLRGLAKQRAALDAEEARWLRVADRLKIWVRVGCVSLLEYMEQRLGYGPRAAQDRLRVAFALDKLPALAESLASGEMPFTAVRELTRVATPETEATWLDAGRDKNVHQIESLVSGHRPGDLPSDAPDPAVVMKVLRFEVRPATHALMRQAKAALEKTRGERLDDDQLIAALCMSVLEMGRRAPSVDRAGADATANTGETRNASITADRASPANAHVDGLTESSADVKAAAASAHVNGDAIAIAQVDGAVAASTHVDGLAAESADVNSVIAASARVSGCTEASSEANGAASTSAQVDGSAEASTDGDGFVDAGASRRTALEAAPAEPDRASIEGRDFERAKYQIAVVICDACKRGWQEGGGVRAPMTPAELERAKCDAQHLGSVDAARPARATQDVPPRVRRLVRRRDGGVCSLPQCRSTRNLELHHIIAREDGGSHEPMNIVQLCDGHHLSLHRGMISITGEAPDRLVVTHRHEPDAQVDARGSKLDRVAQRVQARRALIDLGFRSSEATAAIDAAYVHVGADCSLEILLREALRRCPKPTAP